jgi:hypothetical protein
VARYVYPVRLGQLWIRPNRVFGPFSPCTVYPKPSIRVFLFPVTQLPPLYERMKLPLWASSPLPPPPLDEAGGRHCRLLCSRRESFPPPSLLCVLAFSLQASTSASTDRFCVLPLLVAHRLLPLPFLSIH